MAKEQLNKMQARRLKGTVEHAIAKVPFYRQRYNEAGVSAEDIVDVGSITQLPIIKKEELNATPLRERTAFDIDVSTCIPRTTSGSTGIPLTILEDPYSAAFRDAVFLQFLWAYGVRPWNKVCRLIPTPARSWHSDVRLADKVGTWGYLRRKRSRRLSMADDMFAHMKFFSKWKPEVLIAPPSYLKALMRFSEEVRCTANFKVMVTTGEILDNSTRTRIVDKFHTDVFDYYGTEETGPLAWECPTHVGYHVSIDSSAVEFLHNGEPAASCENGEIHATSFHRMATPIIRYATGDRGHPFDSGCSCGRSLPLMHQVQGRVLDFIITTDGRYISPYTIMCALESLPGLDQYRVLQRFDNSIELLLRINKVKVELVYQNARELCRNLFGDATPIDIRLVDAIDNPRGHKLRVVESQVAR
jgi:phenylacetate-CoA ligase